jgi:invasion protein IalB
MVPRENYRTGLQRRIAPFVVAYLFALLATVPAHAKPEHGQTFKNWTARCELTPSATLERCFIFQNLVLKDSGRRLVHVAVGYLAANGQAAAVITLPLGISLPPGAAISVDGGDPVDIVIERCDANGCIGALALGERLIAELKRGREARISFHDGTRRRIAVPVSLLGFTAGFDSLSP